ncbi:hypothetical protein Aoki45_21400 [Algoriphagus sp. oki45]|uniref:DUF6090 family protein n=1 Tax=Algoriphagus sp. oki45 TaxID=3067294 RepID=UPI0027EEDC8A|nr:hypothetical protein Aoki45_21400 [Algoriphagus sp. oki45]
MISLFRKIRQKLLQQNRVTRYLAYAVGEIVLVVIGILIALQINTWNEQRKDKEKENSILLGLYTESLGNRENLKTTIQHHEALLETTKSLMGLFYLSDYELKNYNLDSLIERTIDFRDFNPSLSVIQDLISSGNLGLISSENLRVLIFDWGRETEELKESYETLDESAAQLMLPYLTKNASMKNIDRYGFLKWEEKSRFNVSTHLLFQELEFENNLDNQAWGLANYLKALYVLEEIIEKIISETSPNRIPAE